MPKNGALVTPSPLFIGTIAEQRLARLTPPFEQLSSPTWLAVEGVLVLEIQGLAQKESIIKRGMFSDSKSYFTMFRGDVVSKL